ncbi:MAG: fatty acid cis/trans isomerase [Congregibacter sp.]
MVCHGCYDAPCQLKMDAWGGLLRGANKAKVYDGTRLLAANLTRLHEDAMTIEGWREKSFFSVLNKEDPSAGQLYRMLALKEEYPQPTKGRLPDSFDFRLNRDQACPKPDEFDEYRESRPYQGMPYGLPGLDPERRDTLTSWLDAGAPGVSPPEPPATERDAIDVWERFLNGGSAKQRLMSRYIFEHLFIGSLYFDDLPQASRWYTLVRSRTPPGQPIDLIATRRPYDNPGTEVFYYRLQPRYVTPLAKRHMPYALNAERRARWEALFLEPDYEVASLPGYKGKDNANPFMTFRDLPVSARYQFMLDEAHFTIMAYIKGPVCRGQVALNVIDDHFWVVFAKPDAGDPEQKAEFLARNAKRMRLPQAKNNPLVSLLEWRSYAEGQRAYLKALSEALAEVVEEDRIALDLDLIWDGGSEQNDNASLTVFRHFDSASVVKGLVGQKPKTMWVIDYSLLERIHYLLVAGFDVSGAVGHQLESRLYMDFLRMEGEQGFLLLLPEEARMDVRNYWYRGARDHVNDYLLSPQTQQYEVPSAIRYESEDPRTELMDLLKAHIPTARSTRFDVQHPTLKPLMSEANASFSFLPEASFLQVLSKRGDREYYSLIHNRAFTNNAQLFHEEDRRLPEEDTLTVARGFVGAYPNQFFQVNESELEKFTNSLLKLASDEDYTALVERYGVRRTAPWFWKLSDEMHVEYRAAFPLEAGLFDLNRYDNR